MFHTGAELSMCAKLEEDNGRLENKREKENKKSTASARWVEN